MRAWFVFVAVMTLTSIVVAEEESDRPIVRWFYQDFPPVFITNGPMKGQGYADKTVRYLTQKLPQYDHQLVEANLFRTFRAMKNQDGVCTGALFRTKEREAFVVFSAPVYDLISNRLIIMREKLPELDTYLNKAGAIDLDLLQASASMTSGFAMDRHYSEGIDRFLEVRHKAGNAVVLPFDHYAQQLIKGRFDFTFGFPAEAAFQFRSLDRGGDYVALQIVGEPAQRKGGIGCSKGPIGQSIIADMNSLIEAEGANPAYAAFYRYWLDERAIAGISKE